MWLLVFKELMKRSQSWVLYFQDLNYALDRALNYFVQRKEWWKDLVKKAMLMDFSWDSSATQYEELYKKAIARARATS